MRQVLYTSNPNAPGGPVLRSRPGQAVFAGQQLRQTIAAPDVFQNKVGFKTLGLFPGTAVQKGRWRALDGNRYVVCLASPLQFISGRMTPDPCGPCIIPSSPVVFRIYLGISASLQPYGVAMRKPNLVAKWACASHMFF